MGCQLYFNKKIKAEKDIMLLFVTSAFDPTGKAESTQFLAVEHSFLGLFCIYWPDTGNMVSSEARSCD